MDIIKVLSHIQSKKSKIYCTRQINFHLLVSIAIVRPAKLSVTVARLAADFRQSFYNYFPAYGNHCTVVPYTYFTDTIYI